MSINVNIYGNRRQNLMTLVDDGTTVSDAIRAAGETVEANQEVRVNGALITDLSTRLEAGKAASIMVNSKNKGSKAAKAKKAKVAKSKAAKGKNALARKLSR